MRNVSSPVSVSIKVWSNLIGVTIRIQPVAYITIYVERTAEDV